MMKSALILTIITVTLTGCATENGSEVPCEYDRYAGLPNSQRDPASIVSTMVSPVVYS